MEPAVATFNRFATPPRVDAENLHKLRPRINKTLDELSISWELTISDTASTDTTWDVIRQLADVDSRVAGARLSRDFRFASSSLADMRHSSSAPVLIIASDIQDPLECSPAFVEKYEQGFGHVPGIVVSRPSTSWLRNSDSSILLKIATKLTDGLVTPNSARLASRLDPDRFRTPDFPRKDKALKSACRLRSLRITGNKL